MSFFRPVNPTGRQPAGTISLQARMTLILSIVAVLNVGGWLWALIAFWHRPDMLGIAVLVFSLGLRHAVDADHIAAIDNVTRKLIHEGHRPAGVGFFFAIGHSAIVIAVAIVAGLTSSALSRLHAFSDLGGTISTVISASLLLGLALMNIVALLNVRLRARSGDKAAATNGFGLVCRIIAPVFRIVGQSWQMLIVGLLFGLGFDTATEVTLFGISATQATSGTSVAIVMIFPVLFAAGMSLVDTIDGMVMLRAYEWTSSTPEGQLRYNLTITFISALVAAAIGSVEAVTLLARGLNLDGGLWNLAGLVGDHFNLIGWLVLLLFAAVWVVFFARNRMQAWGASAD